MPSFNLREYPHRRFDPLARKWILVSPHRTQRPWQGQVERLATEVPLSYDPQCYMCPGNQRAKGDRNPAYTSTFVFDNDYATLAPNTPEGRVDQAGLLVAELEAGVCRVVCFSPRHDLTLARMTPTQIREVVDLWAGQSFELGTRPSINYVQVFENRGQMMGASNPHPHCQIWSSRSIPNEVAREQESQANYREQRGSCLLCDLLRIEREQGTRLVIENEHFMAFVPFWAVWPFETMVLGREHRASLGDLTGAERDGLADVLRRLTIRYDNLFEIFFPYSMGFHQQPTDGQTYPEWHLHLHFYPPLLRSATVRKFMVGYEMLASPQRDITPETAAARLREIREVHWLGEDIG